MSTVLIRDKGDLLKLFSFGCNQLAIAGIQQVGGQLSSRLKVKHVGVSQHSGGYDQQTCDRNKQ